jgi:transposase-like protein
MARTRYTKEAKAGLLEDWQRSEISAAAFCRQRGINYQNFLRWRAQSLRPVSRKEGLPAFVELEVTAPGSTPVAAVPPDATVVELSLGTQTVLRIFTGAAAKR